MRIDLKNKEFGLLTVLSASYTIKNRLYWKCLCKCGNIKDIQGYSLRNGDSRSCGCRKGNYKNIPKIKSTTAFNQLFYRYNKRAKNDQIEFNLNKEEFKQLIAGNCFYCNLEPKQIIKTKFSSYIYNGIDRVDNSMGYTMDNCVSCCKTCNQKKSNISVDIVEKLYYYLLNKGYFIN